MRRIVTGFAVLIAAWGTPAAARPAVPKADDWILVKTDSLEILGNASEAKVREIAEKMEQFRRVVQHLNPGFNTTSATSTEIFLFKNGASFEPYCPPGARAYYLRTPYAQFVTLNATPEAITLASARAQSLNPYAYYPFMNLYHEFTHYLLNSTYTSVPAWLDEGLAEYYATFTVKGDRAEIGRHTELTVHYLRHETTQWFPIEQLFSADRGQQVLMIRTSEFYAQSWATVHYLLHSNERRRGELFRYFEWIQRGMPHDYAFRHSFSVAEDELLREVREYVAAAALPYGWIDRTLVDLDVQVDVSKPSRSDALARLGLLLVHRFPARADEARAYFEEALRLDAAEARAHYGMAVVAEMGGELDQALPHLDRAVAADPGNPLYRLRRGHNRLAAVERDVFGGEEQVLEHPEAVLARARDELGASLKLRDDAAQTLVELGRTYLFDGADPAPGIDALMRAWKIEPALAYAPVALMLLDLRRNDEEQARQRIRDALRMYPTRFLESLESEARRILPQRALDRSPYADEVLRAIDLTLGIRGTGAALPRGMEWGDLSADLGRLRQCRLVLDAAAALRDGRPSDAVEILESLVSSTEDAELKDRATELLELRGAGAGADPE